MTGSGPEAIDDANVFRILAELAYLDQPTHDTVLDRLGDALTALFDVLYDDEVVRWLCPAELPPGSPGPPFVLVVVTGWRLILIDEAVTEAGIGEWPLDRLTSAVHHGGAVGSEHWLEVLVAGVRLALRVGPPAVTARAAAELLDARRPTYPPPG